MLTAQQLAEIEARHEDATAGFEWRSSADVPALLATIRNLLLLANRAYPGLEPYTICSRLHHGPDYTCQVCFPNWPELQENWYRKNNELQAENDALRARAELLTDRLEEWSHAE